MKKAKRTRRPSKSAAAEKVMGTVNVTMYADKLVHTPDQSKKVEKVNNAKLSRFASTWDQIIEAQKLIPGT